jgi:hypothetical protein
MANATKWERRVAAWKASGLSSEVFCKGKPFTAGGLRHWAHRLRQKPGDTTRRPVIRIGRVVRRATLAARPPMVSPGGEETLSAIVVELGAARVAVRPGFDQATLAAVLEVLWARGGRP